MNIQLEQPCDALVRAFDAAELPSYVTTYGTELCLVPHLIRLSQELALESEQEIIQDMGMYDGQYGEGFDEGLRHAARALLKLYGVQE